MDDYINIVQQVVISQKSKNREKLLAVFQVVLDKKNDNFCYSSK